MINGLVKLVRGASDAITGKPKPSQENAESPDALLTKDEIAAKFPEVESDPAINLPRAQNWVNSNFNKIKLSLMTYHQNVWRNILFYVGQTWLMWDQGRRWWIPTVPEDDFTPQPRINYFSPPIDAIASNFNDIPPIECIARDTDTDNDEAYKRHGIAKVAGLIAKDILLRTGMKGEFAHTDEKPSAAALMFVLQGTLCTYVQARDKQPVESDVLGTIQEKSVEVDLIEGLSLLNRPGSYTLGGLSGSGYLHVVRRMTLSEIYNRFRINADPDNESIGGMATSYQSSLNYFYVGSDLIDLQAEDAAMVVETFIPPMSPSSSGVREFADTGLYSVYINQKVKYAEPWKFPEHPITKADYLKVPKVFMGRTPAFDMVPLQEEIQAYESLIKLHSMSNAVSPWVIDASTLVGEITGRADKVVKYRSLGPGSLPPHRSGPGSLDQGVYEQVTRLRGQFEAISGAASVFRGRQEGSVVASSAIAQLRGQAELMFARPVKNWNALWRETIRKGVLYAQKTYTLPQIARIVNDGQMTDSIRDFIQADLANTIEWLDSPHGLPRTQDEQRNEMMELFDKKALDLKDVAVREKLFRLFGETGMLRQFNLDATRARYENKQMKQGFPVTFRPAIEDLEVHYAIHTEFVKSLDFDRLQPVVQELVLAHVMETKAALLPPPLPKPPSTLAFSAKLEDMPAPLVDAVLEDHGITPALPDGGEPPPHHSVGKGVLGEDVAPVPGRNRGQTVTRGDGGSGNLPSQGRPSGSPQIHGQGIPPQLSSGGPKPPSGAGGSRVN